MAKTDATPAHVPERSAPDEDGWAHTAEHREAMRRALADSAAGRIYRLSEDDLILLMDEAEQARQEGRQYRLPRDWLKQRDATHRLTDA